MKSRKMLPGCQVAEALGVATAEPMSRAGSPLLTAAAGATTGEAPPNSRRLTATAIQPAGPALRPSPVPSPNHANTAPLTPSTPPEGAARRDAELTGRTADAGLADSASAASNVESFSATKESAAPKDSGSETDSRTAESASETPEASDPTVAAPGRFRRDFVTDESFELPPGAVRARERTLPRTGALVDDPDADDEPVEPAEPVVSANATGTAAIAEPTPNATANAPTRPTYRAYPDATVADATTAGRANSIWRTCLRDPRR